MQIAPLNGLRIWEKILGYVMLTVLLLGSWSLATFLDLLETTVLTCKWVVVPRYLGRKSSAKATDGIRNTAAFIHRESKDTPTQTTRAS